MSIYTSMLVSIFVIAVFAVILYMMGQPVLCECGFTKLWHGPMVLTSENSQHISDWYTFSHVIHGFIFYWIAWLLGRKRGLARRSFPDLRSFNEGGSEGGLVRRSFSEGGWSIGSMFLLALLVETGWEIFENTDFTINRYRAVTISLDYFGDSVINSTGDVLAMVLGFFLAYRLPVWATLTLIVAMEAFVGYWIRDNLLLNIVMLVYPMDAILQWQSGGG